MTDRTAIVKEVQKYVLKGQIDKAIAEWDKLIREAPDGNAYNNVADLYLKKGDKKTAAEYLHKSANFFRQEGFSLKALALYRKVLNNNPTDVDALYALGQLSEEKGLTTDSIKYYLATADCLSKEGEKDKLLEIYMKILGLSPSNTPLRIKVAEIFLKEGLTSDALKEYITVAQLYEEKEDFQKAEEFYQKALGVQPSNKAAVMGICGLFEKSADPAGAVAHLKNAVTLFPGDTDVLLKYAELAFAAGQESAAEESLLTLRNSDPCNITVRRYLGDIYLKTGLEEKAWEEYIPVIDEAIAGEKYDNAIRLLELFRTVDPIQISRRLINIFTHIHDDDRLAAELMALGELHEEKGLEEEAITCFKDAAEIKPYDEDIQQRLRTASPVAEPVPAAQEEKDVINIVSGSNKSADEIFVETDIFSRYGLLHEAVKLLENLKLREPQNIEVHLRLKVLYAETADKEMVVIECLILHELYTRKGDTESADKMLRDAVDIAPDDARLAGRLERPPAYEPTAFSAAAPETSIVEEGEVIEDYDDALAEADFYIRQGLLQEASKILQHMHILFPGNTDIIERMESLGQLVEPVESRTETGFTAWQPFESESGPATGEMRIQPGPEEARPEAEWTEEQPEVGKPETESPVPVEAVPPSAPSVSEVSEEEPPVPVGDDLSKEYEELLLTEQDLEEAQEMPEIALDNDVLDIFQEFKRGLEKELGDEDSETHYNLGIAYKEMGLIDDAIKEFQSSRNDPKRYIQSSTMLGYCYMEKKLYSLAIDVLKKISEEGTEKDDSYWPVRYELAEAYEKNNNLKEALDLYTSVYGWNANFRGVSERITHIREQIGTAAHQPSRGTAATDSSGKSSSPDKTTEKPTEKSKEKRDRVSYL